MAALATEDVGNAILSNLQGQRETLIHAAGNMALADANVERAGGTLRRMDRRNATDRCLIAVVIILLILVIIMIIIISVT